MATTVAQILRQFGPAYWREHDLSVAQARAWRAIVRCRTKALGGSRLQCDDCGVEQWRWYSCRNRHCPQCQSQAREAWRSARIGELLDTPYCHLVFTLPHELNGLAAVHPRWVYDTLMRTVSQTLSEFAANPRWLGATPAFTLVLHTWTQDLRRHIHVHVLMTCGGLDADGHWVKPKRSDRFLFPVHALSRVFRAKYLNELHQAQRLGELDRDLATKVERYRREQALRRHNWVVYAKTPLAGPAAVLDYLSRYTHRTAIGNERLVAVRNNQVLMRVRANDSGGKRVIRVEGQQFVRRFLQHVLPSGYKRIRHYGLLAASRKRRDLAQARAQLDMPPINHQAVEDAVAFIKRVSQIDIHVCSHCGKGRWQVREVVRSRCAVRAHAPMHQNKGPP